MVKIRYMKLKYKQITKVWNVFSNDFRIPVDSHFDPKIQKKGEIWKKSKSQKNWQK